MFGILDAFKLGLGAIGGAAVAVLFCYLVIVPSAKNDARQEERSAQLQKSMELIQQRGKVNDALENMDAGAICRELGGMLVNGDCQ